MVTIQNYVRAQSIDEAYELNQKKGSCIIGGMLWTKMQDRLIQTAIDTVSYTHLTLPTT